MKAMYKNISGMIMLVVSILTTGGACADPTVIGGNVVVDRQLVDGWRNFHVMDTNNPFIADGMLNRWEVFAENENPVQLVVYRQENGIFTVVGRSEVEYPVVGYNLFDLNVKIKVKAGDFVGMYFPENGAVSFTLDPPGRGAFGVGNLTGSAIFTFLDSGMDEAVNFYSSSNRHYSIRALGGPKHSSRGQDDDENEDDWK